MKAAFWNINMGKNSPPGRKDTFKNWCAEMNLDLLLLEEVSETLRDEMETLTGMEALNYVNTLDKNGNPTTKQLWALQKAGLTFNARPLRFPGLEQKRLLLKVTGGGMPSGFELWVIHANASAKGGAAATKAVNDHLASPSGHGAIVGGDFNYPIASAGGNAVHPNSWQTAPPAPPAQVQLKFTQWNKVAGQTKGPDPNLHITKQGTVIYQEVKPHSVIDYVMKGVNRNAIAEQNCIGSAAQPDDMWIEILREFDHCPVFYDIT